MAERYRERFDDIGRKLGFRGLDVHEILESRARDPATRMTEEAAAILAAVPDKSVLVALDERGENIDSAGFARHLGRWRDQAVGHTIFAIGGADGLSPDLRRKAKLGIAFGSATWPHQMVRVMLFGTDLSRHHDPGRPPLSPRVDAPAHANESTHQGSMQSDRSPHSSSDTGRRGQRHGLRIPLSVALLSAGMGAWPTAAQVATKTQAPAQVAATPPTTAASPDAIKAREQELEATRAQQKTPRTPRRNSKPISRRSDRIAASSTSS